MMILAVDSSAVAASAALIRDGKILGEFYCNVGLTHSQTLMPMIDSLLKYTKTEIGDIDLFAVSNGPGSFTGIRIGIASVKGLAMPQDKPCAGVSTLQAMAENLAHLNGIVCAVMDARCGQVYNALFRVDGKQAERLIPDRAVSVQDLAKECKNFGKPFYLVGDGAKLCYNSRWFEPLGVILAPEPLLYQRASGVAKAAEKAFRLGAAVSPDSLRPVYLRPPQAERSLKKKMEGKEK